MREFSAPLGPATSWDLVEPSPTQCRGWPPHMTAGPGLSRYDQMVAAIDNATSRQTLEEIHGEATAWLLASGGRNQQAVQEAAAIVDRAQRKLTRLAPARNG
jgi:hypothetical protein